MNIMMFPGLLNRVSLEFKILEDPIFFIIREDE